MIDLSPDHLSTVKAILAEHVPECEVRAFGSRATWTAKDYSDLDLALVGEEPLDWTTLGRLKEAFEESDLPMRVDVLDWRAISESFRNVIERDYVILWEETKQATTGPWTSVTLGDVCMKIGSGATPRGGKEVYLEDGPYSLIRSQNVYNTGFSRDGLAFISDHHAEALHNVEVLPDDVLLNITGDSVARVCQVDPVVLPARVNQHVAIIRPYPDKLDATYLRYYLVSPEVQAMLLSWAGSGGTRKALTKQMIESFEVRAPQDPDDQRAIAHVLGTLDDKIELNRRMNETLEEMARALFKSWFVDFDPVRAKMEGRWRQGESLPGLPADLYDLFPDRMLPSELGEIPEGWEAKTLGDVIEVLDSRRVPLNSRQRAKRQGPYPYYGAASVMDHVDDFLFDGVYVLAGEDGTVIDAEGYPVVQYIWGRFWVNNHAHVLQGRSGFSEEHLYLLLKQVSIFAFVTGAVQPKLSQRNLKSVPVIVPGGPTCEAFSDLIGPLFEMVRANTDEAKHLAGQRDTLLPKLVVGEVTRNAVSPSAPVYRESSLLRGG